MWRQMGKKILGSWSGMRNYLEKEILAECLRGRIRYHCTAYVGMDGCHVFEVYIDDRLVKRFSWETVNSYFIAQGCKTQKNPFGIKEYWKEFWSLLEATPIQSRPEHTDEEFCEALAQYRNQEIGSSLHSENPLERMFAVMDRRIGKRRLRFIKEELEKQPEWLRIFYELRLEAENL